MRARPLRLLAAAGLFAACGASMLWGGRPAGATPAPSGLGRVSACPTPAISDVATASGRHAAAPGTTVFVTGSNLASSVCSTSVSLGGRTVSVTVDSASKLQFAMPDGAPGGHVTVTLRDPLGGTATSPGTHDFVALPVVASLSTRSPMESQALTATGSGFALAGLPGASATVSYCGAPAQPVTISGDTGLDLPGPAGYCSGPATVDFSTDTISVQVGAGTVAVGAEIVSVSPAGPVAPGTTVTISGSGFGPAGSATVGGIASQVLSWTDGAVNLVVPAAASSGSVVLVRADGSPAGSVTLTLAAAGAGAGTGGSGPGGSGAGPAGIGGVTAAGPVAGPGGIALGPGGATVTAGSPPRTASRTRARTGRGGAQENLAPGTPEAIAAATGGTGATGTTSGGDYRAGTPSPGSPVQKAVALIAPRPLPLPWMLMSATLLAAVAAAYLATIRRGGTGAVLLPPVQAPPLFWRVAGRAAAAVLAASYLLTGVSVLLTLVTYWLPGSGDATLPGAGLYKVVAILLSLVLTGIAARYGYYYYCWLRSRRDFARPRPVDVAALAGRELPYLKFQVTTRGGALPIVERTVQAVVDIAAEHPWLAPRLSVEVITESADEARHLPLHFGDGPVDVQAVCLPPGYRTPNGTGLKARALHHLVEKRREGWNRKPGRTFIVHLDEETYVTAEHLLVLVDYLSGDPRPVSQGPILYPMEWEKAPWLCRGMESLRPFGCSECARVMSNPPPPHLHGSNLVIDEEAENLIGWDFGTVDGQPYIAEDLLFGLRAYALLGREAFGWHGATMLEQPPLSVYWAVQQRLRWVLGALQGWRAMGQRDDLLSIPATDRARLRRAVGYRIATYALGFPVGFAGLYFVVHHPARALAGLSLFLHDPVRELTSIGMTGLWRLLISLAGVGWIASYQIGLARNLRYRDMSLPDRVRQHLVVLLLTPVTGMVETAGPFLALTRWLAGARQARWTPTPKTADAPPADAAPAGPPAGPVPAGLPAGPLPAPVAGR